MNHAALMRVVHRPGQRLHQFRRGAGRLRCATDGLAQAAAGRHDAAPQAALWKLRARDLQRRLSFRQLVLWGSLGFRLARARLLRLPLLRWLRLRTLPARNLLL